MNTLNTKNCFKDRGSKSSLTSRNILQITTDEGVGSQPEGGCLNFCQRGTIEKSPRGANGTCVMGTDTVSKNGISTGGLDAVYNPSGDGRFRRGFEGLNECDKQRG